MNAPRTNTRLGGRSVSRKDICNVRGIVVAIALAPIFAAGTAHAASPTAVTTAAIADAERPAVAAAASPSAAPNFGPAPATVSLAPHAEAKAFAPVAAPVSPDHVPAPVSPGHRTFGMTMDVGVPDGAALGVVVRPAVDWLRIGAAVTHNGIAPGARLGVTLDPIAFPVAPTLTVEGGHTWQGNIPGVSGAPAIGYNYANIHLGLEFGNRDTFRFFLRGGASYLDISGAQALNSTATSGIGNPSYSGWLAPSAKLGFSLYF